MSKKGVCFEWKILTNVVFSLIPFLNENHEYKRALVVEMANQ
jgi:hypothetical protein